MGQDLGIRVMLVGHQLLLWGLQRLVNHAQPRMHVISMAMDWARAIETAERTLPQVVVVEADLVRDHGDEVIPALVNGRNCRVVVLTGMRDAREGENSVLRGASGVVQKSEPPETLLRAIEKVHEGELWLDRGTTGRLFVELSRAKSAAPADPEKRKIDSLTVREREIVAHLAADPGTDNKRLAGRLYIGEHTVRNHLSRIYDKLGVLNRTELYVYARQHGLS